MHNELAAFRQYAKMQDVYSIFPNYRLSTNICLVIGNGTVDEIGELEIIFNIYKINLFSVINWCERNSMLSKCKDNRHLSYLDRYMYIFFPLSYEDSYAILK